MDAPTVQIVELRCPEGIGGLLMKVRREGEMPRVSEGNLLELNCRDCARNARQVDPSVRRVLHRFSFAGDIVESVVER
jgi:hypothetical protein